MSTFAPPCACLDFVYTVSGIILYGEYKAKTDFGTKNCRVIPTGITVWKMPILRIASTSTTKQTKPTSGHWDRRSSGRRIYTLCFVVQSDFLLLSVCIININ